MAFTRRNFLLSICFLQLIAIIERQVFDFLGYMWAPILVNFFHIIFVIFGVFGAYQLTAKYIVTYSVWNVLWIGWNIFLICFYLNIGILDRDSDILNLGTGSVSWFEVNGYGCKPTYAINITSEDPYRLVRPERVDDCFLEYHNVELIHSAVQCFLAILGLIGAICIGRIFIDEDDDQFDFMGGDAKSPQHTSVHPMYVSYSSIPASASTTMTSNNKLSINNNGFINNQTSNTNTINSQIIKTNTNINNNNHNSNSNLSNNSKRNHHNTTSSSNTNINSYGGNNNNNSNNNNNNRSDIRYTVVSTEHLVCNDDDDNDIDSVNVNQHINKHENYLMNSFGTLNRLHNNKQQQQNDGYIPKKRPNHIISNIENTTNNQIKNSSFDSRKSVSVGGNGGGGSGSGNVLTGSQTKILNNFDNNIVDSRDNNLPILENNYSRQNSSRNELNQLRQSQQQLQQRPPTSNQYINQIEQLTNFDNNYKMPLQYVTRSPNLNRVSSRRRNEQRPQIINFCDQIRDTPPGYNSNDSSTAMQRARSQDRLSYRQRRHNNNSNNNRNGNFNSNDNNNYNNNNNPRPRSYCSNIDGGGYQEE